MLIGAASLTAGEYVLGCIAVTVVVGTVGWGTWQFRRAVLPGWDGTSARLAELIVFLAVLLGAAMVAGSFRAFTPLGMLVAAVVTGLLLGAVGRGLRGRTEPVPLAPSPPVARELRVVAVLGVALAAGQWVSHTVSAWRTGMLEGDTLWYHASFAVRLVQEGRLDILPAVGPEAQSFFPINTQLLHAIALLPFDRDLLAPALNLVFFTMGLMAAWCVGRARGLGPLCLLAGAVVMALPTLAGTHPGQATNDVACAAFVLAAVALVVEGGVRAAPVGIAAVAGGLAIGTKLTVGPAVAMLVLGVVVLAIRDRRWWTALTACVAVVVASAYWFVRNWALIDTPLPWLDIRLGPIQLHQTVSLPKKGAITEYLTDTSVWTDIWAPGLEHTLGPLWPIVLLGIVAGMALAIAPRRTALERLAGLVAVAATFSYLVTPYTMGFGGALFVDTVRYGAPMLLIGFVLMPLGVCADLLGVLGRRIVAGVLALLLVVNALAPADARVEPWGPHALWAGLLTFVVVGAVGLVRVLGSRSMVRLDPRRMAVAGAAVLVVVFVAGWFGQRSYLSRRYVDVGLALDATNARLRDGGDGRVAVLGTLQYYPLFGANFSNRLVVPDPPSKRGSDAEQCARWRRTINEAGADYLVFGPDTFLTSVAEWEWFASDPNVEVVASDSDRTGLLRITGRLDPAGCA